MQMLLNPLSATLIAVPLLLILWLLTRRNGFLVAIVVVNLLLWLSATPWLSHNVQSLLEHRAGERNAESLPRADAIVVLGGILSPPGPSATDANLSAAADRGSVFLEGAGRESAAGKVLSELATRVDAYQLPGPEGESW